MDKLKHFPFSIFYCRGIVFFGRVTMILLLFGFQFQLKTVSQEDVFIEL